MPRRTPRKEKDGAARSRRPLPPSDASAVAVLRVALDVPQNEVAGALGVSPGVVSDLEAGNRTLTARRKDEILEALTLPPDALGEAEAFVVSIRSKARADGPGRDAEEAARLRVEGAIDKVKAAAGSFARALIDEVDLEESRREAGLLWEELERLTPERRRARVRSGPRFRKWAFCELLCQKSLDAAADSAAKALEIASLAVLIAELVPGLPAWRRRLQGYARAHLANAWRVHGKLPESEKEFAQARALWDGGVDERKVLNEARVLGMEALLWMYKGQWAKALDLLDLAHAADQGEEHNKLLVSRASVYTLMQDFEGAINSLRKAAPLISETHEPRLLLVVQFKLGENFLYSAQPEEARGLLPDIQRLTRLLGKQLDSLRLRWLEGRLFSALGQKEKAFIILSQVRDEFASLDMPFDTALATLELTPLLLEQRRHVDVLRLARQLEQIFRAQGAHEKALEAVLIFRKAAERHAVTVEMVRHLIAYMERARYNPELRFEADE